MRVSAYEISETALWEHLFAAYEQAYSEAVESSVIRTNRAVLDEAETATSRSTSCASSFSPRSPTGTA